VNLAARLESQADPGGILVSYETYVLVRDMVEAEEQRSIEAKGIRREIRPFALRNFFDETKPDRVIQCDRAGLTIRIDLDRLSGEHRRDALDQLFHVIERLKG
jgi:hypothetical protein